MKKTMLIVSCAAVLAIVGGLATADFAGAASSLICPYGDTALGNAV